MQLKLAEVARRAALSTAMPPLINEGRSSNPDSLLCRALVSLAGAWTLEMLGRCSTGGPPCLRMSGLLVIASRHAPKAKKGVGPGRTQNQTAKFWFPGLLPYCVLFCNLLKYFWSNIAVFGPLRPPTGFE